MSEGKGCVAYLAASLLRKLGPSHFSSQYAMTHPRESVNSILARVMSGLGLHNRGYTPCPLADLSLSSFDLVVLLGPRVRIPSGSVTRARNAQVLQLDMDHLFRRHNNRINRAFYYEFANEFVRHLALIESRLPEPSPSSKHADSLGVTSRSLSTIRDQVHSLSLDDISHAIRAGIESIELTYIPDEPHHIDVYDRYSIGVATSMVRDGGMRVSSLSVPGLPGLASNDLHIRDHSAQRVKHCLDLCDEFEIQRLVVTDEWNRVGPAAIGLPALARSLESICTVHSSSCVALEFGHTMMTLGVSSVSSLIGRCDPRCLGVSLDVGRAHLESRADGDLAAPIASRLVSVRVSDNDGASESRGLPGTGSVDWSTIQDLLSSSGYPGPLIFDVIGHGTRDQLIRNILVSYKTLFDGLANGAA